MVKNIVFDYGNVLSKWDPEEIVENITNIKEEKEQLKQIFTSDSWQLLDRGDYDIEYFKSITLPKYSENMRKTVDKLLDNWCSYMRPIIPMREFLKEKKEEGYKIYLLSNTSKQVKDDILNQDIYKYFDGMLLSYEVKLLKPDIKIYEKFFERFALIPQECLFIDDNVKNIEAAIDYGMQGYVFDGDMDKFLKEFLKLAR